MLLARTKLDSIENKISETLINNEIIHKDFIAIINEEKSYRELNKALEWWIVKEVIQKKLIWLKEIKNIGIDEVIKRSEIINNSLKSQI